MCVHTWHPAINPRFLPGVQGLLYCDSMLWTGSCNLVLGVSSRLACVRACMCRSRVACCLMLCAVG